MRVIRTWKRDASSDVMALDDAVANLVKNCVGVRDEKVIREHLLAGRTLETPLAWFAAECEEP